MLLPDLSPADRGALAWTIHQEPSVEAAHRIFYETNPESHKYNLATVKLYARSKDQAVDREEYRKDVIDDIKSKPFTQRPERISVLCELLQDILMTVRRARGRKAKLVLTPNQLFQASAECRSLVKEIGEQMIPYENLRDGDGAPASDVLKLFKEHPELAAMIFKDSRVM